LQNNLQKNVAGWSKLVNAKISERDESLFTDLLKARLVVGWGLTPAMIELLDRHNIEFIDVEVDPLRFGDDLFLRVRTNGRHLRKYFSSLHVREECLFSSAAGIRAFVGRHDAQAMCEGPSYALFAGQSNVDLSIVRGGVITKPADFISKIRKIAEGVDIFLVKSHPYGGDSHHLDALLEAIPNSRMTSSHIYRILSDVNLKHVVALSSSVLDEATVFGLETTRLMVPDRDDSDLIPSSLSPWYRIGAEGIVDISLAHALIGKRHSPNCSQLRFDMRRSLNVNWGLPDLYSGQRLLLSEEMHQPGRMSAKRIGKLMKRAIGAALRPLKIIDVPNDAISGDQLTGPLKRPSLR
jgi:hypothetical protein